MANWPNQQSQPKLIIGNELCLNLEIDLEMIIQRGDNTQKRKATAIKGRTPLSSHRPEKHKARTRKGDANPPKSYVLLISICNTKTL